jgi:hypothetical protein
MRKDQLGFDAVEKQEVIQRKCESQERGRKIGKGKRYACEGNLAFCPYVDQLFARVFRSSAFRQTLRQTRIDYNALYLCASVVMVFADRLLARRYGCFLFFK